MVVFTYDPPVAKAMKNTGRFQFRDDGLDRKRGKS